MSRELDKSLTGGIEY